MTDIRIVSGGQTGPDRAALHVARALGLEYGGWCPHGGWAEDHPEPPGLLADYPELRETESDDPADRTRLNVQDSTATLVVREPAAESPGTALTETIAREVGRPHLVTVDAAEARTWLESFASPVVLNVAGPRASEWPEGYDVARRLLTDALGDLLITRAEPG